MIGYASDKPRSQRIPPGFDQLFPRAVAQIAADDHRGRFIAFATDPKGASAVSQLAQAADAVKLPQVGLEIPEPLLTSPLIGDLRRSDHTSFWVRGFPAAMVTDTADFRNPHYHCRGGSDSASDLDYGFLTQVVTATTEGVAQLAR